jgi:hypothetical protein
MIIKFDFDIKSGLFSNVSRTKQDELIEAVTSKMSYLMEALKNKIITQYLSATDGPDVVLLEELREGTGALAESVQVLDPTFDGGMINSGIGYGGDGTWAELIVKGGSGDYVINPIGSKESGGSRKHEKGAQRRFGADYLQWEDPSGRFGDMTTNGYAYAKSVMHPPMKPRPFAELALESMRDEIKEGLYDAILGVMED